MSEHPLRRRYGLELGLGLALAALAAWFVLGGQPEDDRHAGTPASPEPTPERATTR